MGKPVEVKDRTFEFALSTIDLCGELPNTTLGNRIDDELLRSEASVGVNVEELQLPQAKMILRIKLAFHFEKHGKQIIGLE